MDPGLRDHFEVPGGSRCCTFVYMYIWGVCRRSITAAHLVLAEGMVVLCYSTLAVRLQLVTRFMLILGIWYLYLILAFPFSQAVTSTPTSCLLTIVMSLACVII